MIGHERTLRERSFQLTQDPIGFAQPEFDDLIGARLRIAVGINAQLRRVARGLDVRHVAVPEIDAHAVEHIDAHDVVEAQCAREETAQRRLTLEPVFARRFCQSRGRDGRATAIKYESRASELHVDRAIGWNQSSENGLARRNREIVEQTGPLS